MSATVRERLRAALPGALKQRDAALVAALRTTLAALDNAEAVPITHADPTRDADPTTGAGPTSEQQRSLALEQTPVGVGVQEVARRLLSEAEVEDLVRTAIDERQAAAALYEEAGEHQRARRLRQEADALTHVAGLPGPTPPG